MHSKGHVLQHHEHVRHCDAGQDEVDGVPPHVLVGQHQDVDQVEEGADSTDCQGQVAVDWLVVLLSTRWWGVVVVVMEVVVVVVVMLGMGCL